MTIIDNQKGNNESNQLFDTLEKINIHASNCIELLGKDNLNQKSEVSTTTAEPLVSPTISRSR